MKLAELEPQLVKLLPGESTEHVGTIAEADGLRFGCPACFVKNGGVVGTHMVLCWFVGKVTADLKPGPGRWTPSGSGYADLSLSPSVNLDVPHTHSAGEECKCCKWHGWIQKGEAS